MGSLGYPGILQDIHSHPGGPLSRCADQCLSCGVADGVVISYRDHGPW